MLHFMPDMPDQDDTRRKIKKKIIIGTVAYLIFICDPIDKQKTN